MARTRMLSAAAAAAAVFFGFTFWLLGGFAHGQTLKVIDDVVLVAVSVVAFVSAVFAARVSRGRLRNAWTALALGLLARAPSA